VYEIPVIEGDGVGPEVVGAGRRVLDAAADACGFSIE
jgi:isocitrate/isopropylmalate dehydrogenase